MLPLPGAPLGCTGRAAWPVLQRLRPAVFEGLRRKVLKWPQPAGRPRPRSILACGALAATRRLAHGGQRAEGQTQAPPVYTSVDCVKGIIKTVAFCWLTVFFMASPMKMADLLYEYYCFRRLANWLYCVLLVQAAAQLVVVVVVFPLCLVANWLHEYYWSRQLANWLHKYDRFVIRAFVGLGCRATYQYVLRLWMLPWALRSPDVDKQRIGLKILRGLNHLDVYRPDLSRCLACQDAGVQRETLAVVRRLSKGAAAEFSPAITHCLVSPDSSVQELSLDALKGFVLTEVAKHSLLVARYLVVHEAVYDPLASADDYWAVLAAAYVPKVPCLAKVAPHPQFIAKCLANPDAFLQQAAWAELKSLSPAAVDWRVLAIVELKEPAELRRLSRWRNWTGDSLLHIAAWHGRLRLCKMLVGLGVLLRAKNGQGQKAADVAKMQGNQKVFDYLASCSTLTMVRGGSGDALNEALADGRPISKVEWFLMPIHFVVGSHSLLCVTVSGGASDECAYVIEKAASDSGFKEVKNGVFVSHWYEVLPQIESDPIHVLFRKDLREAGITMQHVWKIAVEMGPYDVATCNCHHAVKAVFNACAREGSRVWWMPDTVKTLGAQAVRATTGVDVANSRLASGLPSTLPSQQVTSASHSLHYKPSAFPLGSHEAGSNPWAVTAGSLSAWIYNPDDPKPPEVTVRHTARTGRGGRVRNWLQWSIATTSDTAYVVFRGTDFKGGLDPIIDMGFMTEAMDSGVRVHSSMRAALRQRDTVGEIEALLEPLLEPHSSLPHVVLCGHSLGGGYALLAALELLHRRKVHLSAVLTFGAPQVVVRSPDAPAWRRVDVVATNFVNAYDCIPRLLSCMSWVDALPSKLGRGTAVRVEVDCGKSLLGEGEARDYLASAGYSIIGTLVFVKEGSRRVERVRSSEEELQRRWLEKLPEPMGDFVFEQHDMTRYLKIMKHLFSSE